MSESQSVLFILTSLLVIMIPGQDLLLVLSRGMTQGAKAGITTAAGVSAGLLGHTVLTMLGVGAMLMTSNIFFLILKYFGACYLVYLGFKLIFSPVLEIDLERARSNPVSKLFITGAISNISNPKITIFYFAYLPQFIPANSTTPTVFLFILGSGFAMLTFIVKAPIGYFAGTASKWMQAKPRVIQYINRLSGGVLIALGMKLALAQR